MFSRFRRLLLFALLTAALPMAHGGNAKEYELKAALVYKFSQFTDWPASLPAEVQLCVLGSDPFGEAWTSLRGKPLKQAKVGVKATSNLSEAKACQAIFLNPDNLGQLKQWLSALKNLPILTISDNADAWNEGVMIQLHTEPNRISFSINLSAARQAGLNFQAQMLTLAREVQ